MSPDERGRVREAVKRRVFRDEKSAASMISTGHCPGRSHGPLTPPPPGIIPHAPIGATAHGYCSTCHVYYSVSPRAMDQRVLSVGAFNYPT